MTQYKRPDTAGKATGDLEKIYPPVLPLIKEHTPIIGKLYEERIAKRATIEVILFYTCHLSCNFCYQPHKDKTGMSVAEILHKRDMVKKFIDGCNESQVNLTIFGGEIFGDHVPQDVFDTYSVFLKSLHDYCESLGKRIIFGIPSNLIYNNVKRVADFFQFVQDNGIRYEYEISYNFVDMYTNKFHTKKVHENEKFLEKYLTKVNTVLSKNVAERMVNQGGINDPYYDYLYHKYTPNMITYFTSDTVPEYGEVDHSKYKIMDESMLLKSYMYLFDNYPNVTCIREFIHVVLNPTQTKPLECPNTRMLIRPSNQTNYCLTCETCNTGWTVKKFVEMHGCIGCEYYKSCRTGAECAYEHLDPNLKKTPICLYKMLYKYIERNLDKISYEVNPGDGSLYNVVRKN